MPDDRRRRLTLTALVAVSVLALAISFGYDAFRDKDDTAAGAAHEDTTTTTAKDKGDDKGDKGDSSSSTAAFTTKYKGFADPKGFLKPYPNATVSGLLTFRGNPSRSYYGQGPVPTAPQVLHRFPDEAMCKSSTNLGETHVWCGMGWTGQPTIVERKDRTWAIFGGYDGHIHFMDAVTGERILPDIETGDIIKGTPTIDPEGYPLVYTGSRDNKLRIIATDRDGKAEVLWMQDSEEFKPNLWNDDWDSSPIILGDYMVEGSESSRFWVFKLNRSYDANGKVQVDPKVLFTTPVWDQQSLSDNGDEQSSVESSVAIYKDTAYFGTSAGLIWGYDLSAVHTGGKPKEVFRFWTSGDNDPTVIADDEGFLYVAGENDRPGARSDEVGQLTKLDPSKPDNPIVWKFNETEVKGEGIYGTPGIFGNTIIVSADDGKLTALDRKTGTVKWVKQMNGPVWGSPVVVDKVLLVGDCLSGAFHAYDVSNPDVDPPELWKVDLPGCIEATPAVWKGRVYIGTRAGFLYVLGDKGLATTPATVATGNTATADTTYSSD